MGSEARDRMRSGHMKRTHPVGRMLEPWVLLLGGFLLYVREGACGGEPEGWVVLLPIPPNETLTVKVCIPISSTLDEARALLAKAVRETWPTR